MGRCPLHHVVGVVHVPLAPALRYSSRVIQNPLRTPLNFKAARARLLSLCYILPPASAAFPCVHSFLVCWPPLFFSSSLADVALWLGPYMSISSQKRHLYKDPEGPEVQANHNKPKTTQKQQDDPQIPQPDLRFVKANSKPDTQRGKSPNNNTHKKDLPRDTAVLPLCHTQKHAKKNNYPPRHSVKHRNRGIVHTVPSLA